MKEYYDRRAAEYDETAYVTIGQEDADELRRLEATLSSLPPARTLDVGCGTGFFTRYLRGLIFGVDQSERMLRIARERLPDGRLVRADAASLPFRDSSFARVFSSFFYGHLLESDRQRFLKEARRLAEEIIVVEETLREGLAPSGREERRLSDGSRHVIYKRYFEPRSLTEELRATMLFEGSRFVAVLGASHPS